MTHHTTRILLRLVATTTFALLPGLAAAQHRLTPEVLVGVRFAEVTSQTERDLGVDFGRKIGFEAGADVKIPVGKIGQNLAVSFRPGALFATGGGTLTFPVTGSGGSTTRVEETVNLHSVDVPLLLEVTPQMLDGRVRLLVGPTISTLVGASSVIGSTSTNLLPDLNRISVSLQVGGQVSVSENLDVALLGEIPIVGKLFKQGDEKRSALIVLIQPRILRD